jgi:endonuclease/exonuclease/phosphatase (EEP) superfamily protein YafD
MKTHVSFCRLIIATGILSCLITLAGFAGNFWWIFELATHFRVQYALALGAFVIILLQMRQGRWATIFGAFALLNTVVIAPTFWSDNLTARAAGDKLPVLRALLANVNVNNRDHERIRRAILELDPDVVVLLEATPWLLDHLHDLNERYPHRMAKPQDDPFGIALLSRHPFFSARVIHLRNTGPPAIVAVINASGHQFTVIGTHPWPPVSAVFAQGRNEQLHELATLIRQIPPPLLVLGDLNASPWSPYFMRLIADSGLHNSLQGRGIQPSWPVSWPLLWTPIDHALFSEGIQILQRKTGSTIGSDHYPVIVEFQVTRP